MTVSCKVFGCILFTAKRKSTESWQLSKNVASACFFTKSMLSGYALRTDLPELVQIHEKFLFNVFSEVLHQLNNCLSCLWCQIFLLTSQEESPNHFAHSEVSRMQMHLLDLLDYILVIMISLDNVLTSYSIELNSQSTFKNRAIYQINGH